MKTLNREAIQRMTGTSSGGTRYAGGSGGTGGGGGSVDLSGLIPITTTFWGQTVAEGAVQGSIEAGTNGGTLGGFHGIELNTHGSLSGYGGYIDFHYDGSSADYTSRIMEDSSGVLNLNGQVLITSGGNVGIGTTTGSSYKLRVGGSEYLVGGSLYFDNNRAIYFKDSNGNMRNAMTVNSSNQMSVGYEFRLRGYTTDIQGGIITFATNNGYSNGVDHRIEAMQIETSGRTWIKQGLRIGDGVLKWDSQNDAFYVEKADGSVASFYARGSVSALGAGSGVGTAELQTLTLTGDGTGKGLYITDGDIELESGIVYAESGFRTIDSYSFGTTTDVAEMSYNSNVGFVFTGGPISISGQNNNAGIYMNGSRLYFDSSRYIYVSNGHLYFYNGSTTITLA